MFEFCFCNIKNKKANKKQPLIKSDCFKKSDQEMTASFANGIQLIVFCFNKGCNFCSFPTIEALIQKIRQDPAEKSGDSQQNTEHDLRWLCRDCQNGSCHKGGSKKLVNSAQSSAIVLFDRSSAAISVRQPSKLRCKRVNSTLLQILRLRQKCSVTQPEDLLCTVCVMLLGSSSQQKQG